MRFISKVSIGIILPCLLPPGPFPLLIMPAQSQVIEAGRSFTCTPTAVWDGDGPIWCAEGPKLRIAGVAAREIDGSCRSNQPCPRVSGVDARNRLVELFGGPRGMLSNGHIKVKAPEMTCRSDGSAGGSRTAAWCQSPVFGDLSCAVIGRGGAIRWDRYWRGHRC
jgi:endonuclease YncB( thermonuclease family)